MNGRRFRDESRVMKRWGSRLELLVRQYHIAGLGRSMKTCPTRRLWAWWVAFPTPPCALRGMHQEADVGGWLLYSKHYRSIGISIKSPLIPFPSVLPSGVPLMLLIIILRSSTTRPRIFARSWYKALPKRAMSSSAHFDAAIIGSGQGGTPLASAFANAGKKVALIERAHIGGCCINEGCTPTKTMVASGRVAYLARRAADYGVNTGAQLAVDMTKVRQRKRDIVESFRGGSERRVKEAGIDLIMGDARFTDSRSIAIAAAEGENKDITADIIVINTGARPAKPKLEGLESVDPARVLDSTSIQELDVVPEHLILLGGGYIALEFGQLFRRLGAKVSVVQRSRQLLPREDADIAASMKEILEQDGIQIFLQSEAQSISSFPENLLLKIKGSDGKSQTLSGSHLLVAIGRTPNTDTLDLSKADIEINKAGYIPVNDHLQTSVPHIYALGDVKGGAAFTHVSYDDFRILQSHILATNTATKKSLADRIANYVVYTDPQLGHVGLHEYEARRLSDRKIQVAKMPMSYVARALETDESRGMMKAVVDAEDKNILGFTCLGLEGGEIMAVVQTAMLGNLTYESLRDAVFAHPSLAESLNNLWGFLE